MKHADIHDGKHTCLCLCCANLMHFMVRVSLVLYLPHLFFLLPIVIGSRPFEVVQAD